MRPATSHSSVWVETVGFVFVSITLLLATVYVPWLAPMTLPILPALVTVHSFRRGYPLAVVNVALVGALLFLVLNWIVATFLLLLIILGLALRPAIEGKMHPAKVLSIGWVAVTVLFALFSLALVYQSKANVIEIEKKAIAGFMQEQRKILKESGQPKDSYEPQLKTIEETLNVMPYLLPSVLGLFALWLNWCNFQVVNAALRRLDLPHLVLPKISTWQYPWYFSWGYLLALISIALPRVIRIDSFLISVFSSNLLTFFGFLFMLQGLAVVIFYLDRYQIKAFNRLFLLLLAFLAHLLFQVLTLIGLFDTWFDYRKLSHPEKSLS